MDDEGLERLLRSRRSVRHFRPEPLDRALVERLVEAATLAPSASNKQPWRFVAVADTAVIARLAGAVRTAVEEVAAAIEPPLQGLLRGYGGDFSRFEGAPCVLAVVWRRLEILSHLVGDGAAGDARSTVSQARREDVQRLEQTSGQMSAALAVMNLLTMAHALGLGAAVMTGPLLARREVEPMLSIAAPWELLALVPVGHPAELPEGPGRKPVGRVLRWIG